VTWGFGGKRCFWLENSFLNADYADLTDFLFFKLRMSGSGLGLRFTVNSQQLAVNSFGIRFYGFSLGADWVCLFTVFFGGRGGLPRNARNTRKRYRFDF
jgi:hypothetical protein